MSPQTQLFKNNGIGWVFVFVISVSDCRQWPLLIDTYISYVPCTFFDTEMGIQDTF